MLLGFIATLCLPRQFHVSFVENQQLSHLHQARWIFPGYLLLMSVFTLPLALAGIMMLGPQANVDLVVLQLPLAANRTDIALLAYLGGFSAATQHGDSGHCSAGHYDHQRFTNPADLPAQQNTDDPGQQKIKVVTLRRWSMLAVLALWLSVLPLDRHQYRFGSAGTNGFCFSSPVSSGH